MVMTYELFDRHPDEVMRSRDQGAYRRQLATAHGLLGAAVDELEQAQDIASVYDGKDTGPEASSILKVINLAERKLRKGIHEKPTKEKQVQDAFETLLVGADIPYTREKVAFEYSSSHTVRTSSSSKLIWSSRSESAIRRNANEKSCRK